MVSILDVLDDGLSAVYTFFEPSECRQLSAHSTLCGKFNKPGDWDWAMSTWVTGFKDSPKMSYKAKFAPAQLLVNGQWCRAPGGTNPTRPNIATHKD
jgi:arginyl-tRNA--protein-N-Asp/Glu arginylyltransferase